MPPITRNARKALTVTLWGVFLSTAAVALLLMYFCFLVMTALTDTELVSQELVKTLELDGLAPPLSTMQALGLMTLWFITDAVGVLVLLSARRIFIVIRNVGIYAEQTARLVRRLGWLVFSLAPVSVVVNALCRGLIIAISDPDNAGISIHIGIEEPDIYALVLGLVILALGPCHG